MQSDIFINISHIVSHTYLLTYESKKEVDHRCAREKFKCACSLASEKRGCWSTPAGMGLLLAIK